MPTGNSNISQRISSFLDHPTTKDEKSKVFILFYSSSDLQDLASALDYINTHSPIPLLLRRRTKDETQCVEIETLNTPKMIFGFSPPSGNPDEDLSEIISWFRQSGTEVKLV